MIEMGKLSRFSACCGRTFFSNDWGSLSWYVAGLARAAAEAADSGEAWAKWGAGGASL